MSRRVLVVGAGNLLRRDDGFGVEVARRLSDDGDLPCNVRVVETSIAGVGLTQELMDGYDALLILDSIVRGLAPGTLYLLEPEVPNIHAWTDQQRHSFLADLHQVDPSRALALAAALGVLPRVVRILACEPADCDEAEIGLTPAVERAAALAVERARELLDELAGALRPQGGINPAPKVNA